MASVRNRIICAFRHFPTRPPTRSSARQTTHAKHKDTSMTQTLAPPGYADLVYEQSLEDRSLAVCHSESRRAMVSCTATKVVV